MTYRADIDGLRALAVLPVVFYHAGFSAFSGGYVGVDVFFVISGYLITSLIFDEIKSGQFHFRNFYLRRIRRLFPALFAVVFICCVPAYFLLLPEELEDFGQSVASLAVFSSNILFWSEAGYFANAAELKPLLHTWSLAIEEQYYLFFPALLLLIRRSPSAPFATVIVSLFVASLVLSVVTSYTAPQASFYLLPSRTWELLMGSIIAISAISIATPWLRECLAIVGLFLIGLAVFTFTSSLPFPGWAALIPCTGTALLIVTARQTPTLVARILSDRRLVFFGLISYSLYLWHWPILVFAKHYFVAPLSVEVKFALVAVSVVVSILSWRFIEQPFRGPQGILSAPRLFQTTAVAVGLLIAVGLVYDTSGGFPQRMPADVAEILQIADDKPANRRRCEGIAPRDISLQRLCAVTPAQIPPTFIIWGDSHANMLVPAISVSAQAGSVNGVFAVANGCVPVLGVRRVVNNSELDCVQFNQAVLDLIRAHPQLDTIVLAARWGLHANGTPYGDHSGRNYYLQNEHETAGNQRENQKIFSTAFTQTLAVLSEPKRRVVVIGPVPEVGQDVPTVLAKAKWQGRALSLQVKTTEFMARQAIYFATLARASERWPFTHFPVHEQLCNESQCAIVRDGLPLYFDDNHLASNGIRMIAVGVEGLFDK